MKHMEERGKRVNLKNLLRFLIVTILVAIFAVTSYLVLRKTNVKTTVYSQDSELLRAMTYEQFLDGDENVEGTDNVKFSAFFLRDLNSDGYAEKIKGTCRAIGSKDTMYMEIIVQTGGYFKDGKIQIDGKNFYLQTALPKDNEIKENYIGADTKEICLNKLSNGTQKMITGAVCSGNYSYGSEKAAAIGNNINNYSRNDNRIVLTGTYVDENGTETNITKEINLSIDWYGITKTRLDKYSWYLNQKSNDLPSRINEENGTLDLSFRVYADEYQNELNLYYNYVSGTIPELNGYAPIEVTCVDRNAYFSYYSGKFTIYRYSEVADDGNVTSGLSRENTYTIKVKYPLEAYTTTDAEKVTLSIPVEAYYYGYNNPNNEFSNPYKSNVAKAVIMTTFGNPLPPTGSPSNINIKVGEFVASPNSRYVVKKQKPLRIYNGISSEEVEDRYIVSWDAFVGTYESYNKVIFEDKGQADSFIKKDSSNESMEDLVSNVGIGFGDSNNFLKENGLIKVYDTETGNLLLEITKQDLKKYTRTNPYYFEVPVKHIRVETSETNSSCGLYIYCIKEIDDEFLIEKYSRGEFDELSYIKSNLHVKFGENIEEEKSHQAVYEEAHAIANILLSKNTISSQVTEYNEIVKIKTEANDNFNQVGWKNGIFVVKFPQEILKVEINDVAIDNNNVIINSCEIVDSNEGKMIKIYTTNTEPEVFEISIDTNIIPSPITPSVSKGVGLYAINEETDNYYYNAKDIYDINGDGNTDESLNYRSTSLSIVSPNSMLTNQVLGEFDEEGTVLLSPEIADLKPLYGDEEREKQTVRIGVQMKNNYNSTVSDVLVVGKIPFEGNTYVVSGKDLGSNFTVEMKDEGLIIPEELEGKVTVYYSENDNPNRDINNPENGWILKENVSNWEEIKTFLIDFNDEIMVPGKEYIFYYDVLVPFGVDLNSVTYSHHGIYFSLDTAEGKYRTQTEPNKIGIKIAEKYLLEINKYQLGKDKKVSGATYSVSELDEYGDVVQSKTAKTNSEGKILFDNLYAERIYLIQEIKTPSEYELNNGTIEIIGHVNDETGEFSIKKISGEIRGELRIERFRDGDNKVVVNVEDEAKATMKIRKTDSISGNPIKGVKFKVTGPTLPANGKTITTDVNGEAKILGLSVGSEYSISETKADGYYLDNNLTFKLYNDEGEYDVDVIESESTLNDIYVIENESIPTVVIEMEDTKIPTYNLEIIKIKHETEVTATNEEIINQNTDSISYLEGAKFKLYKNNKELGTYTTDVNGKITINNLYQYDENRNIDQTYVLKEVYAPEGYVQSKDIVFKVQKKNNSLNFIETSDGASAKQYVVDGNTIKLIVEDNPIFKLTKKDGETGELLPNTKFAIYNVENGNKPAQNSKGEIIGQKERIGSSEYYVVTTNQFGEITLDLPEGLYKAVEVIASDEKYDIENQEYYFGIGKSREGQTKTKALSAETLEGLENDYLCSIVEIPGEGYVVGGYYYGDGVKFNGELLDNKGAEDCIVIKYNTNDEIEWVRTFGGNARDIIKKILYLPEDGIIIVGETRSGRIDFNDSINIRNTSSSTYGMITKMSLEGDYIWAKTIAYGSGSETREASVEENGSFLVLNHGYGYGNSSQYTDRLLRYDSDGNSTVIKSYTYNDKIILYGVTATNDGGYILSGSANAGSSLGDGIQLDSTTSMGFFAKYSSDNTCEWRVMQPEKEGLREHGSIRTSNVIVTSDGGYLVAGVFTSPMIQISDSIELPNAFRYNDDIFIVKYNPEKRALWGKRIGVSSMGDKFFNIMETENHKYILLGHVDNDTTVDNQNISAGQFMLTTEPNGTGTSVESYGNSLTIADLIETEEKYVTVGYYNKEVSLGNNIHIYNSNEDKTNGIIIKKVEVYKNTYSTMTLFDSTDINIETEIATDDGGFIVGGSFGKDITINGTRIRYKSSMDGIVLKYDSNGNVEWYKVIAGYRDDYVYGISKTSDGGYIIGGEFTSSSMTVDNMEIRNNNGRDIYILKLDRDGNVEWYKVYGAEGTERVSSVSESSDGDFIVTGLFTSAELNIDGNILRNNGGTDVYTIRFDMYGNVKWCRSIGNNYSEDTAFSTGTTDNGVVVALKASGNLIIGKTLVENRGASDVVVVKYSSTGEVLWVKQFGGTETEQLSSISRCRDGGVLVGMSTYQTQKLDIGDGVSVGPNNNNYKITAFAVKIDASGKSKFALTENPLSSISKAIQTKDGGYLLQGSSKIYKYASNCELEWGSSISVYKDLVEIESGYLVKNQLVKKSIGVDEMKEITINNKIKKYSITTDIVENNGVKGGFISGEDERPYETVKHYESSSKDITIIPDENYEIVRIKVNGIDWFFEPEDDGSYTMPLFENVVEDKHVEVEFSLKSNKITINKVDSETGEIINQAGTTFRIDQIDEREEPISENLLGDLTPNGETYIVADLDNEISGVVGQLTPNGDYYFVEQDDGEGNISYVPINSKTWRIANVDGATTGVQSSTAHSYIPIDLTGQDGTFKVVVNARVSSQYNNDYGVARITEDTTPVSYSYSTGRFIYISNEIDCRDYESTVVLEGGKTYYLHLGYYKNGSTDSYEDQVVFNSVKVYKAKEKDYSFVVNDGKYESTNKGKDNTVCNSYIPLDLTRYSNEINLIINAEVSSYNGDYGFVTITDNIERPLYSNSTGRLIYITANQTAKDYETVLEGGKMYYIHLGYYKNGSNSNENDKFTINSIGLSLNDSYLYHTIAETNTEGKITTQLPFGKYSIKEIVGPNGYMLDTLPKVVEFRADGEHEFNIENDKICNITVHHYIKNSDGTYTTTKICEDEILHGLQGEKYNTNPRLDLAEYELERDDSGEYKVPDNQNGEFTNEDQEVIYYYTQRSALLRVNHLIAGTSRPVILSNGEESTPQRSTGEEGTPYETTALTENEIAEKYELAEEEMPDNAEGTYEYDEVIVNYYYRVKRFNITTEVEEYEKTNILGETELIRGGSISGENMAPYEKVEYDEDSVEDIFVEPDPGYVIKNIKVNDKPIDFEPEPDGTVMLSKFMSVRRNINVAVSFDKDVSQVIVHHYLEGTSEKVPSIYGGYVDDETKIGSIGDPYVTKPTDEISERYEVVNTPDNASGEFKDTTTEVTYYYREVPAKVITNHLINGTTDPVPLNNGTLAQSSTEDGYVTKPYTTEPLTDIDDEYVLVGDSGNTTGNMTKDDTIVNYYYAPKAYAKVNYIAEDWDGNYETLETIDYEGYDGEVYTSHSKDFTGYTLTDVPEFETYELTKDAVTVFNYYYRKNPVSVSLIEKHVDLYTGEIKYSKEYDDAFIGDSYQIDRKAFEGYKIATNKKYYEKLVKDNPEILSTNSVETVDELLDALGLDGDDPYIPKNYKGVLRDEPVEVVYYYVKEAVVIVEYHDINGDDPANPIHPDDIIPGLEKDPYKVEPIDIDGYDLVTDPDYTPTNSEGEMDRDDTIVEYYYEYKTDVVVNYIDISNESKIDSDKKEGHEKDLYKMDQMDLTEHPNYRIVTNKEYYDWLVEKGDSILTENGVSTVGELLAKLELGELDPYVPANYKGEMTKDEIVVNYYYKKQAKVTVKHIDEATETVLKTEEATYDVGDTYTTGPETIENYTLNENKLPGNATGEVKDGGVEVKYYYNKKTTPADPTPGGNTPTPDPTPQPNPNPTPAPGPGPAPAPQPQPSNPAPESPVVTTAKKIYNKVLPRTGDTTVQTATSIIIMVILLNMLVTDKVNQGPIDKTKEERHKKKKVKGKRFK